MDISIWAVLAATLAQFIIGMIWYTPLFGKMWGEMHGFNNLSKEKQQEMMKQMGPWFALQLVTTAITVYGLAKFMVMLPDTSTYVIAFWAWLGFIVPTQYSAVAFGGTEMKWMMKKMLIMMLGALVCLMVGAFVLNTF